MAYAAEHGYVLVTQDLDFGAILAAGRGNQPSVVQIRAGNVSHDAIGERLLAALRQMSSELVEGVLITLDTTRSRLRVLPLRSKR